MRRGPFGSIPMILPQGAGGLTATNMPLRLLVRMAYGVQDFQIVGGPSWQMSSKFDITAKAAEGTTTSTAGPDAAREDAAGRPLQAEDAHGNERAADLRAARRAQRREARPRHQAVHLRLLGSGRSAEEARRGAPQGRPGGARVDDAQAGRDGEVRDRACDQSSQSCRGLWPPRRRTADDDAHESADAVHRAHGDRQDRAQRSVRLGAAVRSAGPHGVDGSTGRHQHPVPAALTERQLSVRRQPVAH